MVQLLNGVRNDVESKELDESSPYYSTLLFEGVINLIAIQPFHICCFLQLFRYLKNHRSVNVLSTYGNTEDESIVSIRIHVFEPIPLFNILIDIPGIKDAKLLTNDELCYFNLLESCTYATNKQGLQEIQILLSLDDCING